MEIKVLSKETIDRIAAGEVVEKPLNVVKELVENSMDAGAAAITVEIEGGGSSFIRVTDDGRGIPAEYVETAFLRHATSKIKTSDDLLNITSLGFRGEALSSISAVSRLTISTKTDRAVTGIQYEIDGGRSVAHREIGVPTGTTIIVRDLFLNVPARKKFLRSNTVEAGAITDLMEQLALSRPDIAFKYIINKKQRFQTPGKGDLKDIIYRLFGKDISDNMIFIDNYEIPMTGTVSGYIGTPFTDRGTRAFEHFFLNGRYLVDDYLQRGIENAYKPYLMQHRFPFCALHLNISPNAVDVNVHPAKLQVHFSDPEGVSNLVYEAASKALKDKEALKSIVFFEKEEQIEAEAELKRVNSIPAPEPFEKRAALTTESAKDPDLAPTAFESSKTSEDLDWGEWEIDWGTEPDASGTVPVSAKGTVPDAPMTDSVGAKGTAPDVPGTVPDGVKGTDPVDYPGTDSLGNYVEEPDSYNSFKNSIIKNPRQLDMFEERLIDPSLRYQYRMIGQLFETYYLIEYKDELLIMDQHAAHEKVKYERLVKQLEDSVPASTPIIPPVLVELPGKLAALYETYEEYFNRLGFETESFGDSTYAIRAVPLELFGRDAASLFMDIMDELSEGAPMSSPDAILSKMASKACKSAVKGKSPLSMMEANALLDELLTLDNPYHCPHGRPTIITMSEKELEKRFKRII